MNLTQINQDIKDLVDGIASYAGAFADYDEVSYLVELRQQLREHFEAIKEAE